MKKVWLIGPGNIGLDYTKVLLSQSVEFDVIGRSPRKNWPVPVYEHGLSRFITKNINNIPDYAIVAVDESQLYNIALELIDAGVKNILIEKPAGINNFQIQDLKNKAGNSCKLFVAYNRRFYQSVKRCKELIDVSSGPINVNFTFTEWPHLIDFSSYTEEELEKFFLCNSSHVPETVFYLAGRPKELISYTTGDLSWHSSACAFAGAGITKNNITINYNAHWSSAGRWGIEIDLPDSKLILRPLEKLQIQKKGSLEIEEVVLEKAKIDLEYKPGLFEEVRSFLGEQNDLCTIQDQIENFKWFYKIANYSDGENNDRF